MTHEIIDPVAHEALPPQDLEEGLTYFERQLDQFEAEVSAQTDTSQYPKGYFELQGYALETIVPQLKTEATDPQAISKYAALHFKRAATSAAISGEASYDHALAVSVLSDSIGADVLGKAFHAEAEDGVVRNAVTKSLAYAVENQRSAIYELAILKEAYGFQSVTELLGVRGGASDELQRLLLDETTLRTIRHIDEDKNPDFTWNEMQSAAQDWMASAIEATAGMPSDEASDYVFSASRRGEDEAIIDIIKKFDHFGADRIRGISQATGIYGLEAYSVEQLERMEAFALDPAAEAERLADHDVIAVMINRFGDHNGVMQDTAANFDDENKRAVFFEVTRMDDIYKHMITLRKAGIKPATLVLAAHSAPGQFKVGDVREKDLGTKRTDIAAIAGRRVVAAVNEAEYPSSGDFAYSMHGMKGMARLVEQYMQSSRALDDNEAELGREKIIFLACHAATEEKVMDINDSGEKVQIGMESVVGQLGSDLAASGVKASIDIYGASGGIQLHRTAQGVHYSGTPTAGLEGRQRLSAQRVRLENGTLTKDSVNEVLLR